MDCRRVNILVSSFSGISQSRTLNFALPVAATILEALGRIHNALPPSSSSLVLTTHLNRVVKPSTASVATLLLHKDDDFVQLRLSGGLRGGKGGFGSQLRAAGGRMSSKRKKAQGENNGSNRNLEGRRLRTVNEAKALAEYLALKPEMDKKEKEEKRKRWQQVIELTERREEELRNGSRGKVDGNWVEEKEEAGEKTRIAVKVAMESGLYHDELREGSARSQKVAVDPVGSEPNTNYVSMKHESKSQPAGKDPVTTRTTFAGFDDDDEFLSGSEDGAGVDGKVS